MKSHTFLMMECVGILSLALVSPVYAQQEILEEEEDVAVSEMNDTKDGASSREALVKPKVSFSLKNQRDPMLSADDILLIKHREQQRLAAEAAERRRQAEAERKRLAEEERRRQWELALIKDPTMIIRNQIHISGLIDKEVLIGGKLYTIGHTYKGARIVAVGPDSVTFSYKGHKFVKKVAL